MWTGARRVRSFQASWASCVSRMRRMALSSTAHGVVGGRGPCSFALALCRAPAGCAVCACQSGGGDQRLVVLGVACRPCRSRLRTPERSRCRRWPACAERQQLSLRATPSVAGRLGAPSRAAVLDGARRCWRVRGLNVAILMRAERWHRLDAPASREERALQQRAQAPVSARPSRRCCDHVHSWQRSLHPAVSA